MGCRAAGPRASLFGQLARAAGDRDPAARGDGRGSPRAQPAARPLPVLHAPGAGRQPGLPVGRRSRAREGAGRSQPAQRGRRQRHRLVVSLGRRRAGRRRHIRSRQRGQRALAGGDRQWADAARPHRPLPLVGGRVRTRRQGLPLLARPAPGHRAPGRGGVPPPHLPAPGGHRPPDRPVPVRARPRQDPLPGRALDLGRRPLDGTRAGLRHAADRRFPAFGDGTFPPSTAPNSGSSPGSPAIASWP